MNVHPETGSSTPASSGFFNRAFAYVTSTVSYFCGKPMEVSNRADAHKQFNEMQQRAIEGENRVEAINKTLNERQVEEAVENAFREKLVASGRRPAEAERIVKRLRLRRVIIKENEILTHKKANKLADTDTTSIEQGATTANKPLLKNRTVEEIQKDDLGEMISELSPSALNELIFGLKINLREDQAREWRQLGSFDEEFKKNLERLKTGLGDGENNQVASSYAEFIERNNALFLKGDELSELVFDKIFDGIKNAILKEGKFSEFKFNGKSFSKENFNEEEFEKIKKEFKQNPLRFMMEIHTNRDETGLKFIVDELFKGSSKNDDFRFAVDMLNQAANMYYDDLFLAGHKADDEYMEAAKQYSQYEEIEKQMNDIKDKAVALENEAAYLEETADVLEENAATEEENDPSAAVSLREKSKAFRERSEVLREKSEVLRKEVKALKEEFEEVFREGYDAVGKKCAEMEKAYFREIFNGIVQEDAEYQAALTTVNRIMSEQGEEFDFTKVFFEDIEYRNAYLVLETKFKAFCEASDFQFKYNEKNQIDGAAYSAYLATQALLGENAPKHILDAADYVKNNPGRFVYSPGLVLGTVLVGWQVAPIVVGGVFAGQMIKKAMPAVREELERGGVFYDIRQARLDRMHRSPYIKIIYAEEYSIDKKRDALQLLVDKNLLFKEDLKGISKNLLEGIDTEKLPSIKNILETREAHLKILNKEVHATDEMRINELNKMAAAGLLYKEDILDEDSKIQKLFFAQTDKKFEDFSSIKEQAQLRKDQLLIAKARLVSDREKLNAISALIKGEIFFEEDMIRLQKEFPEICAKVKNELWTEIPENGLPNSATRYQKDNSLKANHDEFRKNLLAGKNKNGQDRSKDGVPTLVGLQDLYKVGLCFKEDLANVDETTKQEFEKFLSTQYLKDIPEQATFYDYGLARRVVKFGEAISNVIARGGRAVYDNPVNIVYGPMKGMKGIVQMSAEALDETFGVFTDIETTTLGDRVAAALPGDKELKRHATYAFNKGVGTIKWSAIGAGIGGTLTAMFGSSIPGIQIGGTIGGLFGLCTTDGTVSQIPKGGFIRAFKFGAYGALAGAVVAVALVALGPIGWAVGAISFGTAMIVFSVGSSFLPLIILGAVAGYEIAGLTGKDVETKAKKDTVEDLYVTEEKLARYRELVLFQTMPEEVA